MIESMKQQTSHEGSTKLIKTAKEQPKSVEQLIRNIASSTTADFSKPEANLVLSWLLAAERPLSATEIKCLTQVDLQKETPIKRSNDVSDKIKALCGFLIHIRNGVVCFRHRAMREYLIKVASEGKKLRSLQLMQADLTTRLLAYCQFSLTNLYTSTFDLPKSLELNGLFMQNALLEYATRNWIFHFKKSSMLKSNGAFELTEELKAAFPSLVQLSVLEWICWDQRGPPSESIGLHDLRPPCLLTSMNA